MVCKLLRRRKRSRHSRTLNRYLQANYVTEPWLWLLVKRLENSKLLEGVNVQVHGDAARKAMFAVLFRRMKIGLDEISRVLPLSRFRPRAFSVLRGWRDELRIVLTDCEPGTERDIAELIELYESTVEDIASSYSDLDLEFVNAASLNFH